MNERWSHRRAAAIFCALIILQLLAASFAAPTDLGLRWADEGESVDRNRYPSASEPGWLTVEISTPALIAGGSIGLVVRDGAGVRVARVEPAGPRGSAVETNAPMRFRLSAWESGRIRLPLRIAAEGEPTPLRIELAWASLETPVGIDTLLFEAAARPRLTVLGGPGTAPGPPVVHLVTPRRAAPGDRILLLGADLDAIDRVELCATGVTEALRGPVGPAGSGSSRWVVPAGIAPGLYDLSLNGGAVSCGGIRIDSQGGDVQQEPLWSPSDGDLLLIAADPLADAAAPFAVELRARGFRPASTRMSLILRDYGDDDRSESIRRAVAEAYESFQTRPLGLILIGAASEDDPAADRLPTRHVAYAHEYPGWFDSTFADDGAYGDVFDGVEGSQELIVGRIPVRNAGELASYRAKLAAYRAQPAQPRLLFVVGDAAINRDNSDRRRAAADLAGIASGEVGLDAGTRLASSYMPLSVQANRQRAHDDFMAELAAGVGLLEIFGNNGGPVDLAQMLEAPPSATLPLVIPSQMPTEGRLPVAIFHTCLNGAFDEDAHFQGVDSPVETWVREPGRGVVAAIAQSHLTEFFDDAELAGQILRRLGARDGATLGAIHAGTRAALLAEGSRGSRSAASVRMANLIGDPLLVPRLGIETVALDGSFEPGGAWPIQNLLEEGRGWTTPDLDRSCAAARVAHGGIFAPDCGEGPAVRVDPVRGDRMLRLEARFEDGVSRRGVAWKIFDCDVQVREGSVLRYFVRQERDSRGVGSLCVDAVTASGRTLSADLCDASGLPADPARYRYTLGAWHPILVRLDAWAGERIVALYARYLDDGRIGPAREAERERHSAPLRGDLLPGGGIAGAIDEVRVEPLANGPIVDPGFEHDEDRDGSPDCWAAAVPGNAAGGAARGLIRSDADGRGLCLRPAPGEGILQGVGPRSRPDLPLRLFLEATSADGGRLRVAIVDPASGEVLDQSILGPLPDRWAQHCVELMTPVDAPCAIQLSAAGGDAAVRALVHSEYLVPADPVPSPAQSTALRIGPNPSRGTIFLQTTSATEEAWRLDLFDLSGRRRAGGVVLLRPGERRPVDLRDLGLRNPGVGSYCLRAQSGRATVTRFLRVMP